MLNPSTCVPHDLTRRGHDVRRSPGHAGGTRRVFLAAVSALAVCVVGALVVAAPAQAQSGHINVNFHAKPGVTYTVAGHKVSSTHLYSLNRGHTALHVDVRDLEPLDKTFHPELAANNPSVGYPSIKFTGHTGTHTYADGSFASGETNHWSIKGHPVTVHRHNDWSDGTKNFDITFG